MRSVLGLLVLVGLCLVASASADEEKNEASQKAAIIRKEEHADKELAKKALTEDDKNVDQAKKEQKDNQNIAALFELNHEKNKLRHAKKELREKHRKGNLHKNKKLHLHKRNHHGNRKNTKHEKRGLGVHKRHRNKHQKKELKEHRNINKKHQKRGMAKHNRNHHKDAKNQKRGMANENVGKRNLGRLSHTLVPLDSKASKHHEKNLLHMKAIKRAFGEFAETKEGHRVLNELKVWKKQHRDRKASFVKQKDSQKSEKA